MLVLLARLGRLPYAAAPDVQRVESALLEATWPGSLRRLTTSGGLPESLAPLATLTGAAKGIEALFRINLVDNVRLDHDSMVFAAITAGIDVADAILEGDVIERIEIVTRGDAG